MAGIVGNTVVGSRLSRPMQRKLVMLLQCAITDEEGRGKAARAARSLGERTVTELILQHQVRRIKYSLSESLFQEFVNVSL